MEQLIKRTYILKNLENKNSKPSVVKLSKNSHFFADFNLFDLDLKKQYALAVISLNMPIVFKDIKDLNFKITLPVETSILGLVFVIFQTNSFTISLHSVCEQFILFSHLDTIKNKFKLEVKEEPKINIQKPKEEPPLNVVSKQVLRETEIQNDAGEKEILQTELQNSVEKEVTPQTLQNGGEKEVAKQKSEFLEDILNKDLTESFDFLSFTGSEITEKAPEDEYEKALKKECIINDPLLFEDSTLGDNLEISKFNYFDEKQIPQELKEEKMSEQNPANGNVKKYYQSIKSELDELFKSYEKESDLEKLIVHSKFCKITYEKNKYYIVGVIFENNVPEYICYGVPSFNKNTPPIELKGMSSFIPAKSDNSFGYWVMYQDADTGETILP